MSQSKQQLAKEGKHANHVYFLSAAQLRHAKKGKKDNTQQQYYLVIGGFVFVMAGATLYTLFNPQKSFAQMPVVDETSILVHNGQSHRF